MSDPPSGAATARRLDAAGVDLALRRLAAAGQAPWLHAEVARRMAERLQIIRLRPRALADWWSFGGAGADLLAKVYPDAQRIAIEPSEALQTRSRDAAKVPWWSGLRRGRPAPRVAAPDELPPASVQLVWANMMLHAVVDPTATLARWQRVLDVDGFVMFSCLGPDTLRELRALYRRLGWPPSMADFVDMHDLGDMLVHAGFADPVMDQETLRLSWNSAEALLAELRSLGANAAPDRFAGLRTPRWRQRLLQEIGSLAGSDGRIHMSFEIAYGHAFKAAPRAPLSAETTVSLDDMRALVRARPPRH